MGRGLQFAIMSESRTATEEKRMARMEVAARLLAARLAAGYSTAKEFSDKHGINQSVYWSHENATRGIQLANAKKYAGMLRNCDAGWLLTGIGRAPQNSHKSDPDSDQKPVSRNQLGDGFGAPVLRAIRVLGNVQAGITQPAVEWPEDRQFDQMMDVDRSLVGLPLFGLKVVGASMDREFPDGSIAICVKLADLPATYRIPQNKYVVVIRQEHDGVEATIKQYRRDPDGTVWLWPYSADPAFQSPVRADSLAFGDDPDTNGGVRIWAIVVTQQKNYGLL